MSDATQTLCRFFRALDERAFATLAGLLAPDGVWERQGAMLRNEGEILVAMAGRSPTMRIHHLLTNLFATTRDDGDVEVVGYMLVVRHDSGAMPAGPSPYRGIESIRTVRARLRGTPQGWRIAWLGSDPVSFQA